MFFNLHIKTEIHVEIKFISPRNIIPSAFDLITDEITPFCHITLSNREKLESMGLNLSEFNSFEFFIPLSSFFEKKMSSKQKKQNVRKKH